MLKLPLVKLNKDAGMYGVSRSHLLLTLRCGVLPARLVVFCGSGNCGQVDGLRLSLFFKFCQLGSGR